MMDSCVTFHKTKFPHTKTCRVTINTLTHHQASGIHRIANMSTPIKRNPPVSQKMSTLVKGLCPPCKIHFQERRGVRLDVEVYIELHYFVEHNHARSHAPLLAHSESFS